MIFRFLRVTAQPAAFLFLNLPIPGRLRRRADFFCPNLHLYCTIFVCYNMTTFYYWGIRLC